MSISVHRSRAGFAWRSCKVRIGRVRFMWMVADTWFGMSVDSPWGFADYQRHPGRTILRGRRWLS